MPQTVLNDGSLNSRDPVQTTIQTVRRIIVFIVLLLVVGFGYPVFFFTTSIYRADLPVDEINEFSQFLKQKIHYKIPVYLDIPSTIQYSTTEAQSHLNEALSKAYPEFADFWTIDLIEGAKDIDPKEEYVVRFEYVPKTSENESPQEAIEISPHSKESKLFITDAINKGTLVGHFLSSVLIDMIFKEELADLSAVLAGKQSSADKNIVLPYSANYNLVFSLFVENGRSIDWQIDQSIRQFQPILDKLSHFANFSISTQVQYYSKLSKDLTFNESRGAYILQESDLATFINFGDWNLDTHDMNPSINFIIYFPESNYESKPWFIENIDSNAFLVKQWGGVYIFNKDRPVLNDSKVSLVESELNPIMETFASQLFQLLGLPSFPKSPYMRIDSLSRITLLKNLKKSLDNLRSLVKLTESLDEISIPELTKEHVLESLSFIKNALIKLDVSQDYHAAMTLSAQALKNSDRAFFEKEMVQQAYFPSEHRLAVFLPLLGPVGSILTIALLKLLMDLKSSRKSKKKTE
ncbi:glycosyl phosphatidyl inositol 17 [Scheffersomyces xylosifermentans]|uniref:glycosyl phosphatidyl inositol 17 n=1 Tax=Scheffersomyces xylosifermentans TaxID=1304137 RepID=UPI00315C6EEA